MHEQVTQLNRRAFLRNGALILPGLSFAGSAATGFAAEDSPAVRIGLVTDLHYADKPPGGSRHYRETPQKLAETAEKFSHQELDCLVELGDFIDAADSVATELEWLKRIQKTFSSICPQRHSVLGNHCVHTLNKQEFLDGVEQKKSYYSFDVAGTHFIVLDACFRSDGQPYGRKNFKWTDPNIPAAEVDWLREDLKQGSTPTIVFAHQRLDVSNHYGVKNAAVIRNTLQKSGRVRAVFQGHSHKNDYHLIEGIHYCTLVAMVEGSGEENNAYSVLEIRDDSTITLSGFRKQKNYLWS